MKYGVREICDVVLKAKSAQKVGNKIFYKNEPVIYFDTLKTSSMEGAATTVYAQGGRGNSRLVAWEGERTVTFTMEDALISTEGFMILSGAGLVEASSGEKSLKQHMTETVDISNMDVDDEGNIIIDLTEVPYLPDDRNANFAYVMFVRNGEIVSEPFIPAHGSDSVAGKSITLKAEHEMYEEEVESERYKNGDDVGTRHLSNYQADLSKFLKSGDDGKPTFNNAAFDSVIVDYYVERTSNAQQIEITADKFGGNYYLEASTLFRDTNGVDMPAEFIIPNCKIQSNFTFTMASSGDPSTFTFTMDAFPDYTRFDHSKKVLAAIQIIQEGGSQDLHRHKTDHESEHDEEFH